MRSSLPTNSDLDLRLFGFPQIFWQGKKLELPSDKALALFCYLCIKGSAVTKEDLFSMFWPNRQQQNLRLTLRQLRNLFDSKTWLEENETVSLKVTSDLQAFKEAVGSRNFTTALELYAGEPEKQLLHNFVVRNISAEFDEALNEERNQVDDLLKKALTGRALEFEAEGKYESAIALWHNLHRIDPLEETAHRGIIRSKYRQGYVQEALAQYDHYRKLLREDGTEPSAEILNLIKEIERSKPHISPHTPERLPSSLLRPPELIGREREWTRMEEAWEKGLSIFIAGPPGSGKTRLMMDFALSKGTKLGHGAGRPGDAHIPYSSFARNIEWNYKELELEPWAKRELSRLVPHIYPEKIPSLQPSADPLIITQALHHFVLACVNHFDCLIGEDIHFFDPASMAAGNYSFPKILELNSPKRLAISITTFRPAEMPEGYVQSLKLNEEQGNIVILELKPLSEENVQTMLETLELPNTLSLAPHVHKLSGGNPQLILEAVKSLHETGSLKAMPERIELTDKLEAIIQKRLASLSKPALELSQTLALFQQKTEPELVKEVLELDLFALSKSYQELEQAQMIADGFFVHDLIYEAIRRNTPELLKQLLHKRIARVLESQQAEPARIAEHWFLSGETQRGLLWRYQAAELASQQGLSELAKVWLLEISQQANDKDLQKRAQNLFESLPKS